jgi:hypothetical protein
VTTREKAEIIGTWLIGLASLAAVAWFVTSLQ